MRLLLFFSMLLSLSPCVYSEEFTRLIPDIPSKYHPGSSGAEAGLWLIMGDAEESLKKSPSRLYDPELNKYLSDLVCKLTPDYCTDIRIYVIRRPYFNASMAPNGTMQIWTGLLLRAKNEAQLASVLGHEIGHYLKQHSIKRFDDTKSKASIFSFFTLGIAGAVGSGHMTTDSGSSVINITQFALVASIFSYSRSHEYEADKFGIQLMSDAGLNTNETAKLWESIIDEENAANFKKLKPSVFFYTHPAPKDRIRKLNSYSEILSGNSAESADISLGNYRKRIGPHMKTMLTDELNLRHFGQTQFLLQSLLTEGISPGLINYFLGELHRIRNEEGDLAIAMQFYQEALKHPDHDPELYRSLGILHIKEKEFALANAQFSKYLMYSPEANDRKMIEYYMTMGN